MIPTYNQTLLCQLPGRQTHTVNQWNPGVYILTFLILAFNPEIIGVEEQGTDENAHERKSTGQSLV